MKAKPVQKATAPNEEWSMDFASDSMTDGSSIRYFNVIDNYSRTALAVKIAKSFSAAQVIVEFEKLIDWYGVPKQIRTDNGPEFRSLKFQKWCEQKGIQLNFIQPGKPMQNAYAERLNGTVRRELLNSNLFSSLKDTQQLAEEWRIIYNEERPHQSLRFKTPSEVWKEFVRAA